MKSTILASLVLGSLVTAFGVQAADPMPQAPQTQQQMDAKRDEMRAEHQAKRLAFMKEKLGLSDEQVTKVKAIMDEREQKMKVAMDDAKKQMETVLTADQLKKMQDMRGQHDGRGEKDGRHGDHHGGGQGGHGGWGW